MASPSVTSNLSMLLIDYPPSVTEIKEGTLVPYKGVPLPESAPEWVQLWIGRQKQLENDMVQLYTAVADVNTRATTAFQNVETTYDRLYEGTKYLYELAEGNRQQSEVEVEKRLLELSEAQQTFTTEVGKMIALHTKGKESKNRAEALQIKRIEQAVEFAKRINELQGKEQSQFCIEVSEWAGQQTKTVATLRQQLDESIAEIRRQKEALKTQEDVSLLQSVTLKQLQKEAEERSLLDATPLSLFPRTGKKNPASTSAQVKTHPAIAISYAPAAARASIPFRGTNTAAIIGAIGAGQPWPLGTQPGQRGTFGAPPAQATPQLLPSAIPMPQTPSGGGGWTPPRPTGNAGGGRPPSSPGTRTTATVPGRLGLYANHGSRYQRHHNNRGW